MKFVERYGKLIAMSAAALGMTAALTIESATAYFTTYVSAGGSHEVSLGSNTVIREDVREKVKHITIKNPSETNDCFVRAKIFSGAQIQVEVSGDAAWEKKEDGYWYYVHPLKAGASTSVLDAAITVPEGYDRDDFNVVVIQECTPVAYDEEGNETADWTTVYSGISGEEARD